MSDLAFLAHKRAHVEAAIREHDSAEAYRLLRSIWQGHAGVSTGRYVADKCRTLAASIPLPTYRIAILRSFTVEPVVPLLCAEAAVAGFELDVHLGGFNTYTQEVLNSEDALYAFAPDAVIVALALRDIAPALWQEFADLTPEQIEAERQRLLDTVRSLLTELRQRSSATVLLHNFELPPAPTAGVLDAQQRAGQGTAVRLLNIALQELVEELPGVYLLDYDELISRHGRQNWYDEGKWQSARLPLAATSLLPLAREWVRYLQPLAGRQCKAAVLDLDNTLWGGIVGEDGAEHLHLGIEAPGAHYVAFQRALLDLYRRGIILAIASKNNYADAMAVIESHPHMLLRPDHIAALRINWNDKATSIREIAAELNIGLDAICFIDDNPIERELVRSQLPMVTVLDLPPLPDAYAAALRSARVFERLTLSQEDRERGAYYAQDRLRNESQHSMSSVEDFLRSLHMQVMIESASDATIGRMAQLTQKTNQFNLTTRRYTEQELLRIEADPRWSAFSVRVADRFGDSGLTGVVLVKREDNDASIDTLLLSCRVMGRGVERGVLAAIAAYLHDAGVERLRGAFSPTAKNEPAKEFYASQGFQLDGVDEGGASHWNRDIRGTPLESPDWLEVRMLASPVQVAVHG